MTDERAPVAQQPCPYIELQSCSNFSFLRGASRPEELARQAASLGYPAFGLTDRHSLAGVVRAHTAAKECGIRCLVGTQIPLYHTLPQRVGDRAHPEELLETQPQTLRQFTLPYSLLLYPTNREAYGRLSTLLTKGKLRAPKGQCYLTLADLHDVNRGMIALVVVHDLSDPLLLQHLKMLQQTFTGDRLSLVTTHVYGPDGMRRLSLIESLSQLTGIPEVVTNDVHAHIPERRMLQDVLTCIRHHTTLAEAGLRLFQNGERFLKPPQEMERLFRRKPTALRRSKDIAELLSSFSLDQLRYEYPHEICPANRTPIAHLQEMVRIGSVRHYPNGVPPKVLHQIERELELIEELDYAKYFLTVYDIVTFARGRKILCQGRGAAANSAVCYVLGITAVDPDRVNLLFERFISKERNEPPDIDIDFEHERREEVIQYIYQKYGRQRAALTAAVITYRTKSAVRDVGKVFGLSTATIEAIIRLLSRNEDEPLTAEAFAHQGLDPTNRSIRRTVALAVELRGFPRHLSQHVGGFIISESPLCEIVPIENAAMPERTVIEWDKDDIEALGMLKIDILALGMLTMIRKAFALINERLPEEAQLPEQMLMLHTIPPEDPRVYDMICKADTIGVFQIESRAQQSMLPRLRPRCFYDLVIEVAIVRPGPIQGGMVHPYLRRRNGSEQVSYPDERVRSILEPTLGVPVFQEQVMELAIVAAGFTAGEADQIRRAMTGWRKRDGALRAFRARLVEGMKARGYRESFALSMFEQIKGFGEYGFPQSHAASFALLVYVSCWLKRHHHAAFTTALLNSQPMGFYQPAQLISDAKAHGVVVLPIDALKSDWDCTLEDDGSAPERSPAIRLGLRLVKGLPEQEGRALVEAVRRHTAFPSLSALWRAGGIRAASVKRLARADAFRSLGLNRQKALWEAAKLRDDPLPLFMHQETEPQPQLPPLTDKAQVVRDYLTTGFSLKAHPMGFLRETLAARGVHTAADLRQQAPLLNGLRASVAGMVLVRQRPSTSAGVVFVTLEDETGLCNLIVRPNIFKQYRDIVCDSALLLAEGKVQFQSEVLHILADQFVDVTKAFETIPSLSRDFH
ncbi:MAG: error-prone DNA polymerase [Bdellovibrionales bacterium]|nr:error-prone DNA polymerase [Bdellovibrionales bacterium]